MQVHLVYFLLHTLKLLWLFYLSRQLPPPRVVTGNPWRCFSTLWTNTGRESNRYHNNNFLCKTVFGFGGMLKSDNGNLKIIKELSLFLLWTPAQAVHILSMMEGDISGREAEVRNLRREADALSFQAAAREEEHKKQKSVTSLLSWRLLTAL